MAVFGMGESDPVDILFESGGYETSDFFINLGTLLLIIVFTPVYFLLASLLLRRICCISCL